MTGLSLSTASATFCRRGVPANCPQAHSPLLLASEFFYNQIAFLAFFCNSKDAEMEGPMAAHSESGTAAFLLAMLLNRRARHRSIRTKDTAVASFRLKHDVALLTFIEPLTRIRRHAFGLDISAFGAGQG